MADRTHPGDPLKIDARPQRQVAPPRTEVGMARTPDQSSGSKAPAQQPRQSQSEQRHQRHEDWRPRIVQDHSFNVFESDHQGPDSVPPPSKIQDATQETTPLQGTRDHSEEDSLEPDYVASEPDEAAEREPDKDPLGSPDPHASASRGTASDTARPNDRSTLGR
jgi:hypothetical protein